MQKNTETLKIRNEHMNVHINCRPRNLRNQGAQCARPKVRNVRNVRSPRCAMCGVKARNVHNQCVANCTTGWLRMTTKHVHFKNQIFCNIWFSGSQERAIFQNEKSLSHEHVGVNMWVMGRLVTHTGGTHRWAKGWTNSEQMERTLWLWRFC